jgi:protease I
MRKYLAIALSLLLVLPLLSCAKKTEEKSKEKEKQVTAQDLLKKDLDGVKILMVIAQDRFQDDEYAISRQLYESLGAKVTVASKTKGTCTGLAKTKVESDLALKDVNVDDYDGVVFIGGPGAETLFKDEEAFAIARATKDQEKVLGAICLAPVILANAGVLQGVEATVWQSSTYHESVKMLEQGGAIFAKDKSVKVSGNIITANGPQVAQSFAEKVAALLKNQKILKDQKAQEEALK